jgi:hypothetical protein
MAPAGSSVAAGDPAGITVRVMGQYDDSTRPLEVQVLSNPDDMASWNTIATTRAQASGNTRPVFSVDVRPVASDAERVRWPRGGVLRMRVVDDTGYALPYSTESDDAVLAIANAAGRPDAWTYLTEKPLGSIAETQAYYVAIDAPATLDAFMQRYGFPGNETTALYYNEGDLGIGRDMHCRATTTPAGGVACYVRNFGIFGGNRTQAFAEMLGNGIPIATVAMVYTPPIEAPNAVTFIVYGPDSALAPLAQLDSRGDNTSIPQNCLNCHGGRATYDPVAHAVSGARFLPFDPAAFAFDTRVDLTLAAQEAKLRRLNQLVLLTAPPPPTRELVDGMFPPDQPHDPDFVPTGWNANASDRRMYREVVAPYCRGCHASFSQVTGTTDPSAYATADALRARSPALFERVCGAGPKGMPSAEATTTRFFESSARGVVLQWLDMPGACTASAPAL